VGGREKLCDVRVGSRYTQYFQAVGDPLCATEKESLEAGAMILQQATSTLFGEASGPT